MHVLSLTPPAAKLDCSVPVPGSKSYTNRALVTAALAQGMSRICLASMSTDSEAMIEALRKLGVAIHLSPDRFGTSLIVEGRGGDLLPYHGEIDVGPAGTTMRFLTALCAAVPGIDVTLRGTDRMHKRPIRELVEALRVLGAEIDYVGTEGCPPLRISTKNRLRGGTVTIDGSVSSQFMSAILLAAPLTESGMTIEVAGEQISKSYIDMTIQSIGDFGVTVTNHGYCRYEVAPGQSYASREYRVEGDASGASYLWGIAAVSGGRITVENINPNSAQGDIGFPELLAHMGCSVQNGERSITVTGPERLRAIRADMSSMPDTAQTLAVVAACAEGETHISGLRTLRIKETDRIAALHAELMKTGIQSEPGDDTLLVRGGMPHAACIKTYEDHRMAMSFAILGAILSGIRIEEPGVVDKSFPNFWETMGAIGIASSLDAR